MPRFDPSVYFVKEAEPMFEREGTPFSSDGSRSYTTEFLVMAKVKAITEIIVCTCPGVPLPYSPHPSDFAALCTKLSARRKEADDWVYWIVSATFETKMPSGGPQTPGTDENTPDNPQSQQNNPEHDPPDIEWDFETSTRAPSKDLNEKAFLNSAGQPYTPSPSFEYAHAVLCMSRNELSFNRETASKYAFSVNSKKFLGADIGCVQCMPPKAKLVYKGSINYWRVSYRLRFGELLDTGKMQPWDPVQILDSGLMEMTLIPGSSDKWHPSPILRHGVPISQPVCLDGKGKAAEVVRIPAVAGPPFGAGPAAPERFTIEQVWNSYRIRRAFDFDKLLRNGLGGKV